MRGKAFRSKFQTFHRYAKKASSSALKALRQSRKTSVAVSASTGRTRKLSGAASLSHTPLPSPSHSRKNSDTPDYEGLRPANAGAIQVFN